MRLASCVASTFASEAFSASNTDRPLMRRADVSVIVKVSSLGDSRAAS